MSFLDRLRNILEKEEKETVGSAFGGLNKPTHKSFSVTSVRNFVIENSSSLGNSNLEQSLKRASQVFSKIQFKTFVANFIRYSFLIELTNLKVGSTKMKTRWLPGKILMPQKDSFEPIQGTFKPGNDPRAATFKECVKLFVEACTSICDAVANDSSIKQLLEQLNKYRRVPYEFPLSYKNPYLVPVHTSSNVSSAFTYDLRWLLKARKLLNHAPQDVKPAIIQLEKTKLEVKIFKTDRALTGKDKTNRAKRWEILADDFQHATLEQCWSAERKLTADLIAFIDFPQFLKSTFVKEDLISANVEPTRCPVTLELLSFKKLAEALLAPTHGISQYQVGHLNPLKRDGKHNGKNVCWQSAHGNRIQGDLSIEETHDLLDDIAKRRATLNVL